MLGTCGGVRVGDSKKMDLLRHEGCEILDFRLKTVILIRGNTSAISDRLIQEHNPLSSV